MTSFIRSIRQLLILLGLPGYYFLLYSLILATSLKKSIFSRKKLTFGKRKRGRPKKIAVTIKRKIKKIIRLSKKINRSIKKFLVGLKKIRIRKRKRGRPKKKIPLFKILITKFLRILKKKKLAFILIIIGLILILFGLINEILSGLPSPDHLIQRQPSLTTKIYDRNGVLLYKIYRNQNRTLVPLEKIPSYFIEATLAIEDKEFYFHNGLSWRGILRALKHNLLHPDEPPIGGSTITQQLVKNALLGPEKTWRRKIREAILALLVEVKFSKNEILQMYFNEVPYGGTAYGAEEAAQKYFGKHVWQLNLAESALLAGLTRAPTKYSPFGAYPELAKKRQIQVLQEMVKAGYLSPSQAAQAIAQPLRFASQGESIKAPHFVFYIKDLLVEKYGQSTVEQGGLTVFTSLDWPIQKQVEAIVQEELAQIEALKINNAAALVIKPPTGEIIAMVGSKDYFDFKNDGNVNVVLRPRQPGSAIKPVNYAVALSLGYTAATIIPDTPITYRIPGQPAYSPKNYDNQFHGPVPLRVALASSLNVPAVKVLSSYGVERMIEMGRKLGITTWTDPSRFGLSLTLGGGEVKMIDLAQVYSVLANLGKKVPLNPILKIKNAQGKIIYQNLCLTLGSCPRSQVLDPGIAFILTDILADNQARALGFGLNSLLKIPKHKVAVKTGTSNNLRDNWAIGYTPSWLAATWVGNNDNSPMSYVASGITGATPIWHRIMRLLLKNQPQEDWPQPNNVVKAKICLRANKPDCPQCTVMKEEFFLQGTVPRSKCSFPPKNQPQPTTNTTH